MSFQAAPGVFDIIPENEKEPWKESSRWAFVESVMIKAAQDYNFREIRTPIFERTELFLRSVGEETDIVSKEMYEFKDKGERSLTLRPEGTASVVRALLENRLLEKKGLKFFYTGPMFRYERMQAGRYRQFHHFGVEAFGNGASEQDAEIIDLAYQIYSRLGLKGLKVKINTLADKTCRDNFRQALIDFLKIHESDLSEDSRTRLVKNPLRVLDSKNSKDQEILTGAPSILDFLNEECKDHFEKVKTLLNLYQIPFEVDPRLVRGLDYYQKTVFEIISEDLGAQNTLCGGGRYDGLVKNLGGPDTPSVGFGMGIERALLVMIKQNLSFGPENGPLLYMIAMGEESKKTVLEMAHNLRKEGLSVEVELEVKKVGKAIAKAVDLKAKFVAVIGERELSEKLVSLKELSTEISQPAPFDQLKKILLQSLQREPASLNKESSCG